MPLLFPQKFLLGVFVTGGVTRLLVEQIGLQNAREMILFGERYSASDAKQLGFSWRIVEDEDVIPIAKSLAQRIAVLPSGPVTNLKQALQTSPAASLEAAMALETEATLEGFLDPLSAGSCSRSAVFRDTFGSYEDAEDLSVGLFPDLIMCHFAYVAR